MIFGFLMNISIAEYGQACDSCHRIAQTLALDLVYQGEVIRSTRLCQECLKSPTDVEFEIGVNVAPRGSRARVIESRRLETILARDMRAAVQPGSGCSSAAGYKGDVRKMGQWRVEHKFTGNVKGYNLKLADMAKVIRQADSTERPAMVIEFRKFGERLVVIPFGIFEEFVNADTDT